MSGPIFGKNTRVLFFPAALDPTTVVFSEEPNGQIIALDENGVSTPTDITHMVTDVRIAETENEELTE